jgi:AcrR family transcriptional regulator
MPRKKEQHIAIQIEKKQKIMNIALHLFAEEGYAHTSIDKIATMANISKGLMYTYFHSKDDLLYQIYHTSVQTMASDLFHDNMESEEFVSAIGTVLDAIEAHKRFFKLYTALSMQPGIIQKLSAVSQTQVSAQSIQGFLQKQFGDKAEQESIILFSVIKGYSIYALFDDNQNIASVERMKETIMNFIRERYSSNK